MNTAKKIFALALLLVTVQANSIQAAAVTTLPNTSLRVIALSALGTALAGYSLTMVFNIINKIIENDPTIDETTLRQKVTGTLRYGFGLAASMAGTIAGFAIIVNSNKDPFISR